MSVIDVVSAWEASCNCGWETRFAPHTMRSYQMACEANLKHAKTCATRVSYVVVTDDCDGAEDCVCGRVYPHRASSKRIRRQHPSSFALYIYLHQTRAWERHESSTAAMRDCLRAIWQSAGHATAVER